MASGCGLHIVVLAKAPRAGHSKTRLCPPCSPEQAAGLAASALADTLQAVAATPAAARTLVLDRPMSMSMPDGFAVIPQRGGPLDERLAAAVDDAFAAVDSPLLLIGMDTPQVTAQLLTRAGQALLRPGVTAVFGPATDGGWWLLGLHRPDPALLLGVPTSSSQTGRWQRERLVQAGLRIVDLPTLTDVDTIDDAHTVAAQAPHTRFAATLATTVSAVRAGAAAPSPSAAPVPTVDTPAAS